ncbi:hypothetical protein [Sutcliffiella sp. NC1]|uniref:hypothetical protein n=1 Tax=Sutcliffiella sp. NC1 TaxID=3004096 RepID=UPI0022DE7F49|nr:hypothetical protein [Sutcliffiella sp. NC1]WBL15120.1 hypothetical protein O1A01_25215 [Sutcliffiella sp. NC1]
MYNEKIEESLMKLIKDDISSGLDIKESLWSIFEKGMFESLIYDEIKNIMRATNNYEQIVTEIRSLLYYEKIKKYEWLHERDILLKFITRECIN